MGLHSELNIYKVAADLASVALENAQFTQTYRKHHQVQA